MRSSFALAIVSVLGVGAACRAAAPAAVTPSNIVSEARECVPRPGGGCSREDLDACTRACTAADPDSCVLVLERVPGHAHALSVLEGHCRRDPACGCAWLGSLLPAGDEPSRARALELARTSCEKGALPGCDHYEIEVALCLQHPEGPMCARLRQRGELPPEPSPLRDAFGCRSTEGPIGPHAVVCLAEDRVSILDVAGRWEQWQVAKWERDDTRQRAIWVATLVDGAPLRLTPIAPERRPGSSLLQPSLGLHVVGAHGLLHATLGARDLEAEDVLATLPNAEDVCRHADACERAIAAARAARIRGGDAGEIEEPMPSTGRRTLRHCHARWSAAARGEPMHEPGEALPAACGNVRTEHEWGAVGGVEPPYPPPPEPW